MENSSDKPDIESTDQGGQALSEARESVGIQEDVDLIELLSSIRKFEEYLIVRDVKKTIQEGWLFSEGSSSFLYWLTETYRRRSIRPKYFNPDYFSGEAAWNMLLDLAASRIKGKRISVTSACLASGVPPTTALRWISLLEEDGMVEKENDYTDKRRTFLRVSDSAMKLLHTYYCELHSYPTIIRRGKKL